MSYEVPCSRAAPSGLYMTLVAQMTSGKTVKAVHGPTELATVNNAW
jgi:hypothetical protein